MKIKLYFLKGTHWFCRSAINDTDAFGVIENVPHLPNLGENTLVLELIVRMVLVLLKMFHTCLTLEGTRLEMFTCPTFLEGTQRREVSKSCSSASSKPVLQHLTTWGTFLYLATNVESFVFIIIIPLTVSLHHNIIMLSSLGALWAPTSRLRPFGPA